MPTTKTPRKTIKVDEKQPYVTMGTTEVAQDDGTTKLVRTMTLHVGLETFGPVNIKPGQFGMGDAKIELVILAKAAGVVVHAVPIKE